MKIWMCSEWVGGGGDCVGWFFTADENISKEWENAGGKSHKQKQYIDSHTDVELVELIEESEK